MQLTVAAAIECAIRAEPQSGLLRIEAVARSVGPREGQYRFLVTKSSETGQSSSAQSGTFVLQGGGEQVLTTLVLDQSANGTYRAELSLKSDQERATCRWP
jgi:hypothetical protein